MSRGKPAALLRNGGGAVVSSGNLLRRLLVGIQFAIVIGLLLASVVVRQQIDYTLSRDRGYSVKHVIGMRVTKSEDMSKTSTLVNEFKRLPGVAGAAVAGAGVSPGIILSGASTHVSRIVLDGILVEAELQGRGNYVDVDYFNILSMRLLAGREFSADVEGALPQGDDKSDASAVINVILNASAVHALGFITPDAAIDALLMEEAVDNDGQMKRQSLRVIGVVADTQFASVILPPIAQYYRFSANNSFVAVRLEPDADQAAVLEALRVTWRQFMGDVSFLPLMPDAMEGYLLSQEEFEARIVIGSALLALVIALLGLYGLVEATVAKRVKEIGVRKVMGADTATIISLLLWQFSKPIVIANLVAWPLGLWGVRRWLQRFPYKLDTATIAASAVAASVVTLLVAWLVIGLMAARAASAKPVLALRYE
jgi:putative ABC transport system permease protein